MNVGELQPFAAAAGLAPVDGVDHREQDVPTCAMESLDVAAARFHDPAQR